MKFEILINQIAFFLFLFVVQFSFGQTINTSIPNKLDKSSKYLFFLHGRIVEEQGVNALHPEYGNYEYLNILDSLKKYFHVISEARPKDTDEIIYANKVVKQIDTLIKNGISPKNIFVLGASKGAYIALWVSNKSQNDRVNFIFMGVCSEETSDIFGEEKGGLCGNFLSIYEASDILGASCISLLKNKKCTTGFKEIELTMNNKHGFLYKPYSDWMTPLIEWTTKTK